MYDFSSLVGLLLLRQLMHGAVRLLDLDVVQLGAEVGLDVGKILLPESLLLGFSASVSPSALLLCASALMREIFSGVIAVLLFYRKVCYNAFKQTQYTKG